jgi:uncharacterized protein
MDSAVRYIVFANARSIAEGPREEVVAALKARAESPSHHDEPGGTVLVFEIESGRQVELDWRGVMASVSGASQAPSEGAKTRGRPKLGVVAREVTLLPRHWEWLETQPSGASAALRRLVEAAMKAAPGKDRARLLRAGLSRFLTAMAGDRPHFEEATRALFAGDTKTLEQLSARWPRDIRAHVLRQARAADQAEHEARGERA